MSGCVCVRACVCVRCMIVCVSVCLCFIILLLSVSVCVCVYGGGYDDVCKCMFYDFVQYVCQ